jgi:hypothetical protein
VLLKATVLIANAEEAAANDPTKIRELQVLAAKIQMAIGKSEGLEKIILTFDPAQADDKALWEQFVRIAKFGAIQFKIMVDLTSIASPHFA